MASNITTVTVSSGGYLFTYSQDAYFTGGVGLTKPFGRSFSVVCPNGVQAQASTAGPTVGNGANITIKRTDEKLFNLRSFTGKILLNTAGAALEIMPQLNDNDAFTDPLMYDCTGYAGMSFPYTTALTGCDSCLIHMWGDFALTHLTLVDASVPPVLECSLTSSNYFSVMWPTNSTGYTLQQSSTLNSNNWTTVTDAPVVSGTNYLLLVNLTNDAGFFRLNQWPSVSFLRLQSQTSVARLRLARNAGRVVDNVDELLRRCETLLLGGSANPGNKGLQRPRHLLS